MACNDSIPTLSLLNHWNHALNGLCPRCSCLDESFLHCISQRLYDLHESLVFYMYIYTKFFNNMDPRGWLKLGLASLGSNTFAAGVLRSWRNRNSTFFSNARILTYCLSMEARNLSTSLITCFHHATITILSDRWV